MSDVVELKYWTPRRNRNRLLSALRYHTHIPERHSHSQLVTRYYDDSDYESFVDSKEGQLSKVKFRFRDYLNPDGGAFHSIELKYKEGAKVSKTKEFLYQRVSDESKALPFRKLLNQIELEQGISLARIKSELPETNLKCVATLYYDRHRFEDRHGRWRFNLDSNIRIYLNQGLGSGTVMTLEHDIFEMKGLTELPDLPYLSKFELQFTSFSKYSWGVDHKFGTNYIE